MRFVEFDLSEHSLLKCLAVTLTGGSKESVCLTVSNCTGEEEAIEKLNALLSSKRNRICELVVDVHNQTNLLGLSQGLIHRNCHLYSISFERGDFHPEIVPLLIACFEQQHKQFNEVKLNRIAFTSDEQLEQFFTALFHPQLSSLRIFLPDLERGWIQFLDVLPRNQTLTKLHTRVFYGFNPIPLFRSIAESNITELNLGGSYLFNSGAVELAELLPCTKIAVLNIQSCKIGHEGGMALALALKDCACLVDLDFSYNAVRDEVVVALAASEALTHMKRLVLAQCELGDASAIALAKAMRSTRQALQELNLSSNALMDAGVCALAVSLKSEDCQLLELLVSHASSSKRQITQVLCGALRHPNCKLKMFHLYNEMVDEVDDGDEDEEDEEEDDDDDEEDASLRKIANTLRYMMIGRQLLALASPGTIPRVGKKQSKVRRLPQEMFRMLAGFLV